MEMSPTEKMSTMKYKVNNLQESLLAWCSLQAVDTSAAVVRTQHMSFPTAVSILDIVFFKPKTYPHVGLHNV